MILPSAFCFLHSKDFFFTFQSNKTYYHPWVSDWAKWYFFKPLKDDSCYVKIQIAQWPLTRQLLHNLINEKVLCFMIFWKPSIYWLKWPSCLKRDDWNVKSRRQLLSDAKSSLKTKSRKPNFKQQTFLVFNK